jgi:hypothetical protein
MVGANDAVTALDADVANEADIELVAQLLVPVSVPTNDPENDPVLI